MKIQRVSTILKGGQSWVQHHWGSQLSPFSQYALVSQCYVVSSMLDFHIWCKLTWVRPDADDRDIYTCSYVVVYFPCTIAPVVGLFLPRTNALRARRVCTHRDFYTACMHTFALPLATSYCLRCMHTQPLHRYFTCSLWFMDAYHKGLNSSQAAYTSKQCHGHHTVQNTIFEKLADSGF